MISVEQIRAARGLLGWSQTQLAKAAERSLPTIKRLERNDGEGPSVSEDVREAVQRALEKAGVEFIAENGGGAGARLKFSREEVWEVNRWEDEGGVPGEDDIL